jgi:ADP-heptose:LPS heptosyltransferase
MDIQWMKRVDRLAGYPICGALRAVDALRRPARPRPLDAGPARIGAIKFWGMGSLILAAPMFAALRRSYPRAQLHLITLRPNQGILDLLELADEVHYLDLPPGPGALAAKILSYLTELPRLELDAVIDLEYLTRFSAITCYLTDAPVRVGFHSWDVWRGGLHTVRRAFNPYWHVTENFLNLYRALGKDDAGSDPVRILLSGAEDTEARRLLADAGIGPGERLIAVNANASTMALARRWPEAHFIELIDRMVERKLGRVALVGAPDEAVYVEGLRARTRRPEAVVSLAGKSSLRGLVGILRAAALLVTNDSGPLHLADALGTPTVSFFGPETPTLYGPRGPRNTILYRGIDCSPCISIYNAKTVRCMRSAPECLSGIGVDEALAAVTAALEAGR